MKRKLLVSILIIFLILSFVSPASAQLMPSVTGTYSISTTPAADASRVIAAAPGQTIQISATASGTYSGPTLNDFPVTVTTYVYLYRSGVEQAVNIETIHQDIDLVSGDIPPTTGTTSITVPSDAEPGTYLLKIIASLEVEYMGVHYSRNSPVEFYTVNVAVPGLTGRATATPSPTSAPEETRYDIGEANVRQGTDGNLSFQSGEIAGNLNGAPVAGSVDVNLTHVPSGTGLSMYMASTPDSSAESQFMLAAAREGSDITDIACVLVVDHPDLQNGEDIASATITMKVAKTWVDARGGIGSIQVFRYSGGYAEALETTYVGMEGDMMVFRAFSPQGLSQFALVATAALPLSAAETAPQGAAAGSGLVIGIIGACVIVLVGIVGAVLLLQRRKQTGQQ